MIFKIDGDREDDIIQLFKFFAKLHSKVRFDSFTEKMILTFRTHKHKMSLNIFYDYKMQVIPFYPHRTSRVYDTLHDDAYSTASTKFLINH